MISPIIGIALAKLVELPVLELRDRFFPSRSRTTSETQRQLVPNHERPLVADRAEPRPEFAM